MAMKDYFTVRTRNFSLRWWSHRTRVGIEITDQGLKLVELAWRWNKPFWLHFYDLYLHPLILLSQPQPELKVSAWRRWHIETIAQIPIEKGAVEDGVIFQLEPLASAVVSLVRRAQASGCSVAKVSLSIAPNLVFQHPLGRVGDYFGIDWLDKFDPLPNNHQTLVLKDVPALELTQQLLREHNIQLPVPANQAFLIYLVDDPRSDRDDLPESQLVMVICRRSDIRLREQMMGGVHPKLARMEPSSCAVLRVIGLVDPILHRHLAAASWIWISLENNFAAVMVVTGQAGGLCQSELSKDTLRDYLAFCIDHSDVAIVDIVVSGDGHHLLKPIEEMAVYFGLPVRLFDSVRLSQLFVFPSSVAKQWPSSVFQIDWMSALGLAAGLVDGAELRAAIAGANLDAPITSSV